MRPAPLRATFCASATVRRRASTSPPFLLPLEGQTAGPQRILDQQIALGYTGTFGSNRVLDLRLGLSRTKAGKSPLSEGTAPVLVNGAPIPGLPTAPASRVVCLPSPSPVASTSFGRQTTNPQFQNPALIDPKANFTWIKGKPLAQVRLRIRTYLDGRARQQPALRLVYLWRRLQRLPQRYSHPGRRHLLFRNRNTVKRIFGKVADTYLADFLFGTTSAYALANYFEAHLRQTSRQRLRPGRLEGAVQPDIESRSPLGVRLALFGAE